MQIDFDPSRVAYERLLAVFWAGHDPAERPWKRQYMSAIFPHDAGQRRLAEETRAEAEKRLGRKVHTEIISAGPFYLAEDYHQKYYLRGDDLLFGEYARAYPEGGSLVDSTAAARVNGYLGGFGSTAMLQSEIALLGLSPAGRAHLERIVRSWDARRGQARGGPSWTPCPVR